MFTGRATSDLHLTERTAGYVFNVLRELRNDAADRGGTTVLVGDILDQPNTVHMPTYNRLRDELQAFPGTVYVIAGNHDQYHGSKNALEALEGYNVRVVSEPLWTEIGLMVPYQPASLFWEVIAKAQTSQPATTLPIWWTHQGWKGAYLNNMVKDRDGLSASRVTAELVVTGHYHCPQNIGPIIYCGSPYQTSFAEEGQKKGWLRFDEGEDFPSRVPFLEVGAPKHWTIHWSPDQGQPQYPEEYQPGDRLRIVTEVTKSEVKQSQNQLKKAGMAGVPVMAKPDGSQRQVIDQGAGPKKAVNQYIERVHGIDPNSPNPVRLDEWAREHQLWD